MAAKVIHLKKSARGKLKIVRPRSVVDDIVDAAKKASVDHGEELEGYFVSARRIETKALKLTEPTDEQKRLLRWVWMRNVRWVESLGMHWTKLGGLLVRGYLERREENGIAYLRVVKDAEKYFIGTKGGST